MKNYFFDSAAFGNLTALGEESFLEEIMNIFFSTAGDLMHKMQTSVNSGDATALRHAAHTLKGAALGIGANPLAAMCMQIEHDPASSEAKYKVNEIVEYLNQWIEILKKAKISDYKNYTEEIEENTK